MSPRALIRICLLAIFAISAPAEWPRQASTPSKTGAADAQIQRASDAVLADMSKILSLPIRHPVKASVRTKAEVHQFLVNAEKSDETPAEKHARIKTMQVFGLIPPDFDLEAFEIKFLTESVAGLYDPKTKEFFISDEVPEIGRRFVMAHELTHALQDQNFQMDEWVRAGRSYDGMTARQSIVEGSAMMSMIDYAIRPANLSVRDLADISRYIRPRMPVSGENLQLWLKTPPYLHDEFLFVYLTGGVFSQRVLQAHSGWADFRTAFENPPASTSQVMHPELYFKKIAPEPIYLPDAKPLLSSDWKELDDNVLGELRLRGVLTKYVGWITAGNTAATWAGDRYQIWEDEKDNRTLLIYRQAFNSAADASNFFTVYSRTLDAKYNKRSAEQRQSLSYSFHTDSGGVSLTCSKSQCLVIEGANLDFAERYASNRATPPRPLPQASRPALLPRQSPP